MSWQVPIISMTYMASGNDKFKWLTRKAHTDDRDARAS